jgi:hypothetical protein
MNSVIGIEAERARKDAWTTKFENCLMAAGMLLEEARAMAKDLASRGWKDKDAEQEASKALREMGWSAGLEDVTPMPVARTPMRVVGFEEEYEPRPINVPFLEP